MVVVNTYIKVVVRKNFLILIMIICNCCNTTNFRETQIVAFLYDQGWNQKIPSHHNLYIFIYYYHVQYRLDISCFVTAIQILVDFHVSRDVVGSCVSPTLSPTRIPLTQALHHDPLCTFLSGSTLQNQTPSVFTIRSRKSSRHISRNLQRSILSHRIGYIRYRRSGKSEAGDTNKRWVSMFHWRT